MSALETVILIFVILVLLGGLAFGGLFLYVQFLGHLDASGCDDPDTNKTPITLDSDGNSPPVMFMTAGAEPSCDQVWWNNDNKGVAGHSIKTEHIMVPDVMEQDYMILQKTGSGRATLNYGDTVRIKFLNPDTNVPYYLKSEDCNL